MPELGERLGEKNGGKRTGKSTGLSRAWLLLVAAIVAEVTATLCLKAAMDLPGLYVVVVAGYTGAFACLALCLRHGLALGVAYGIWGASGVALTALASAVIFAEPVTPMMWGGIACVAVGVLMIEVGSQFAQTKRDRGLDTGPGAEAGAETGAEAGIEPAAKLNDEGGPQ